MAYNFPFFLTYNTAAPTLTNLQTASLQGDVNGNLLTRIAAGPGSAVGSALFISPATGASFAVTGTFWQATQPISVDGTKTTASALAAGGIGTIGWLSQTAYSLGEVQASPTTNTILDRLKTISTNQTNGLQTVLMGKVITSAPANTADTTVAYPALDGKQRIRVENPDSMDPWQTYVEKYGSISTSSATDVIIANATAIATGYPAQSIDYTVSVGKTFYLKKLTVTFDSGAPSGLNYISLSIGGSKKIRYSFKTTTNVNNSEPQFFEIEWPIAYPVAASTAIQVYVRTDSAAATIFWVRFEGFEETN